MISQATLEIVTNLCLGTTLVALLGLVVEQCCTTGARQAMVWRAAVCAIVLLSVCELTGTSQGLSHIVSQKYRVQDLYNNATDRRFGNGTHAAG